MVVRGEKEQSAKKARYGDPFRKPYGAIPYDHAPKKYNVVA